MSDKKTLNINPDLFSFSKNNTRKKRSPKDKQDGIKIKESAPKKKNDSLKKKSILKMIRQHQEERYKKLFESNANHSSRVAVPSTSPNHNDFNKEFQEAKLFLENLTEKSNENTKIRNHTLRQYPVIPKSDSLLLHPSISPLTPLTAPLSNIIENNPIKLAMPLQAGGAPQYGCLKNGSLPTYRDYMNKTRKNQPIIIGGNAPISRQQVPNAANSIPSSPGHKELMEKKVNESLNRVNSIKQMATQLDHMKKSMEKPKKMKRKKTLRRTYKIGKSEVLPKVSVLVSNKTLRNNITTKKQLLKQDSIPNIKKYLIKRGFIKVGSVAPNDVLRKMYESAVMICGDVQNYNPENLLYNFMHGSDH